MSRIHLPIQSCVSACMLCSSSQRGISYHLSLAAATTTVLVWLPALREAAHWSLHLFRSCPACVCPQCPDCSCHLDCSAGGPSISCPASDKPAAPIIGQLIVSGLVGWIFGALIASGCWYCYYRGGSASTSAQAQLLALTQAVAPSPSPAPQPPGASSTGAQVGQAGPSQVVPASTPSGGLGPLTPARRRLIQKTSVVV